MKGMIRPFDFSHSLRTWCSPHPRDAVCGPAEGSPADARGRRQAWRGSPRGRNWGPANRGVVTLVSDPHDQWRTRVARLDMDTGGVKRQMYGEGEIYTQPPARETAQQLEVRLNNIALGAPRIEAGWLTYSVTPSQLATGSNLVGIKLPDPQPSAVTLEKVEIEVAYPGETR